MCSVGSASRAKLDCSVLEEDWQKGQSYTAHWHSLDRHAPQHQDRVTVIESDHSEKHREARLLLQRFLSGAINKDNITPKRPHQAPSDPSAMMRSKVVKGPVQVQEQVCRVIMKPKSIVLEKSGKKTVVKTTKLQRFLG